MTSHWPPKKPCETCGHAKTHHAKGWIPIPSGGNLNYINFMPCQECDCSAYKFNLDPDAALAVAFVIEKIHNKITKIVLI